MRTCCTSYVSVVHEFGWDNYRKLALLFGFTRILMEPLFTEHPETDPEHGKDGLKESCYIALKSGGGSWLSGNVRGDESWKHLNRAMSNIFILCDLILMMCTIFFFPAAFLILTSKADHLLVLDFQDYLI